MWLNCFCVLGLIVYTQYYYNLIKSELNFRSTCISSIVKIMYCYRKLTPSKALIEFSLNHRFNKRLSIFSCYLFTVFICNAQKSQELTVEKIMRDSKWLGVSPSNIEWSVDSKTIYFEWDPKKNGSKDLYKTTTSNKNPQEVYISEKKDLYKNDIIYSKDRKKILFERNGDLFLKTIGGKENQLTRTVEKERNPIFNEIETKVIFQKNENFYSISVNNGQLEQLTNFTYDPPTVNELSKQDQWLMNDQLTNFDVLKQREENRDLDSIEEKESREDIAEEIYLGEKNTLNSISISPDMRFVVFSVKKQPEEIKNTLVPNYVTVSGYTENIPARSKVSSATANFESRIYDRKQDRVYNISTENIPGIRDIPEFLKEYPKQLEQMRLENEVRKVVINDPIWNPEGSLAVVDVRSQNNKDRWIMKLDLENGTLVPLERQHDEAWIGGPGIGRGFNNSKLGWIDNNRIYFQSEETGYSHIYTLDINDDSSKKQLTSGEYEVQTLQLSNNREKFYFTGNKEHPGITHFYEIEVNGGEPVQLTSLKGGNEVILSPNEEWLAIRHSYTTRPWELYLQKNTPKADAERITKSTSEEFESYPWRDPEMVTFKNRHGIEIHAQVFSPEKSDPAKPAIVFMHSNGYLQNVHYRWSYHFREYLFHNLLVDRGYTVINIDYTASSGYGRDMRTGIYRHMGGKDLSDLTDGTRWLIENYDVNPDNIGIYGGSYGGFLTLMGLFTEPEVFKSGAALRSVTDWAHYNQGYTSNILNEPITDEIAYKRSSPIYFAEGFEGHLLMTHGIIDVNVQFQDIIRLTQRLIELGKRDWELAVYPLEDHDFIEPTSWTDQYHRILKLFDETLKLN